ncbi:MAG: MATE family efflux transporter [Oscillospiraceae bacterium]|nr:MATE family efflux transporter [Oscillospiraceae bacterium]
MADRTFSATNDMTVGTPWRKLFFFALPIMAGQFLQQLYNTVDGIVVGNYVSEAALAAVGSCTTLANIFLAFALGFGNGCGIMISQLYGARRKEALKSAAATALTLLAGLGLLALCVGFFGAHWFVTGLLNIKGDHLIDLSVQYFAVYSLGLVFQFLYNCIASILRAIGDSRATLYFLCVSAILNLVLDLLFVAQLGWGVVGAAAATVIAQFVCVIVCFLYLFGKYPVFRFRKGEFRFSAPLCRMSLEMGIPMTLQQCIVSFGNVFMQRLVNHFGQVTMAAFTCGLRIENYCMIPALSMNSAMSMFTGQNIGAGNVERVEEGWRSGVKMAAGLTFIIATILFAGAYPLAGLFGVEGESLAQAVDYIRTISYLMIIFSVYLTTNGVIQGSGDVLYASLCSLSTLGVRVALSYLLVFGFGFGHQVIWRCIPIGWIFALLLSYGRFRSGIWKKKAIIGGEDHE